MPYRAAVLAAAAFFAFGSVPANAETPPAFFVTYIEATPTGSDTVATLLRRYKAESRSEPGAVSVTVLQRIEVPRHFAVVETWQDAERANLHHNAPHAMAFRAALVPVLSAPLDERPHAPLVVGATSTSAPALVVLTHVDIIPTEKETGIDLVRRFSQASASEPGVAYFDALTQSSRTNHMTLVEGWASPAARDDHTLTPSVRAFRETDDELERKPLRRTSISAARRVTGAPSNGGAEKRGPGLADAGLADARLADAGWCPGAESNHRHCDFQSHALPTELPGHTRRERRRAWLTHVRVGIKHAMGISSLSSAGTA